MCLYTTDFKTLKYYVKKLTFQVHDETENNMKTESFIYLDVDFQVFNLKILKLRWYRWTCSLFWKIMSTHH